MRSPLVRLALPALLIATAFSLSHVTRRLEAYTDSPYPSVPAFSYRPATGPAPARRAGDLPGELPLALFLRPGETVGGALADLGLEPADAAAVIQELERWADLRRVRPSDVYSVVFDGDSALTSFELTLAEKGRVRVDRRDEAWRGSWSSFERTVEVRSIEGVLEGSLEESIRRAGGEALVAYLMAEVFEWDLDFTRDLRAGDRFRILYERAYLDGIYSSLGRVLAVSYTNRGKTLEGYRFGDGFYDSEGRPMRKMFLRSPLRYSRVTSKFSKRRFHPILKSYRPHYGVDYGAPTGTPVRATASGVVAFAGWDRGGGKTVKVRHPNGYLTAYLHLSRIADGVRTGRRVGQKEVVGYVGATGLATAPHLDYRVQQGGRWIDPLSLKSMPAEPIPQRHLAEFNAWRNLLRDGWERRGTIELPEPPSPDRLAEAGSGEAVALSAR